MAVRIDHLALAAHDTGEPARFLADVDVIHARLEHRGVTYRADPQQRWVGEYNTHDGGRGPYSDDPAGHDLDVTTRRHGSDG